MLKNKNIFRLIIIFLFLLAAIIHIGFFIKSNPEQFKGFFSCINTPKDKQLAKVHGKFCRQASFISDVSSKDSLIILPPREGFGVLGHTEFCGFFVFPRLTANENANLAFLYDGPVYRVNVRGFEYKEPFIKRYDLNKDFSLLFLRERSKEEFAGVTDFTKIKDSPLNIMPALLKLFLIIMSGLYFVLKYFKESSLAGLLAASFLAGTVIVTVLYIIITIAGIDFAEITQFVFLSLFSALGIVYWVKHGAAFHRTAVKNKMPIIIVGIFFVLLLVKSAFTPIIGWDACAIWGLKAKAIYALHNLSGLKYWGAHSIYPPLFPVLLSLVAIGGEKAVTFIFPLFALFLYIIIYDEISETAFHPAIKIFLPLLLIFTGEVFMQSLNGYANLALTVFVTKAVVMLRRLTASDNKRGWISLALMLCGVILVRPDGRAYFLYIALLAILWVSFRKFSFSKLAYLLIPAACALLWLVFCRIFLQNNWSSSFLEPEFHFSFQKIQIAWHWNLKMISANFMALLFNPKYFGFMPLFFVLACLLRCGRVIKNYAVESLFVLISCLGIFLFAVCVSSAWGAMYFFETGFTRSAMVFVPCMFIVVIKEIDCLVKKNSI